MQININQQVEVVLTAYGADIANSIEASYEEFRLKHGLNASGIKYWKEGDVYKDYLWSLMQEFGPNIMLGLDSPFKECIINVLTK